jgi:hypothetical protein
MKNRTLLLSSLLLGTPAILSAQPEPPVPVRQAPGLPAPVAVTDNQRLYGPSTTLVAPAAAQAVIEKFKAAYEKLGRPRLVIYVNRELVDTSSGFKLTRRVEQTSSEHLGNKTDFQADPNAPKKEGAAPQTQVNVTVGGDSGAAAGVTPGKGETSSTSERVTAENTYTAKDAAAPALADRQTVRDLERLFGRPLRIAGATLADQRIAASLLPDKSFDHFTAGAPGDQAAKDREALAKVADVAIEILVSSRNLVVKEVSGDQVVPAPDIQATAIRLSDAQILGQASASDVLGKDQQAGMIVKNFDVRDIAEATALALMEDLAQSAK